MSLTQRRAGNPPRGRAVAGSNPVSPTEKDYRAEAREIAKGLAFAFLARVISRFAVACRWSRGFPEARRLVPWAAVSDQGVVVRLVL
jgi:hypothetical protein